MVLRIAAVCALTFGVQVAALSAFADAPETETHLHVGNTAEYPNYAGASPAGRARADRIHVRSNQSATRFSTIGAALRRGYRFRYPELYCPGLAHMRKHGGRFWGRVLDPTEPQALLWWCSSSAKWTLVALMYRAPGQRTPPLYGGLLGWHQHTFTRTSTWMTHVWLTSTTQTALATCAPFGALAEYLGIAFERYFPDIPPDRPCSDTAGASAAQ
jgi:hypothetical protein